MFTSLKGRVAIVTGAASGIGEATALKLASVGMNIALLDFNEEKVPEVIEKVRQAGGDAIFVQCDICQEEQIKNAINTVVKKYGKLNALVNCAGVGCSTAVFHEFNVDVFDRLMKINLRGTFLMMKYGVQAMLKTASENCSIVNLSSTSGISPSSGSSAYAASKFGVIGLTKSGAVDYAMHNITVNAICPYMVKTGFLKDVSEDEFKMYEQSCANGRSADPDEIAYAVLFLISDMARYINGEIMSVDAGKTVGDILPLQWNKA